jgi:hypothetical protein
MNQMQAQRQKMGQMTQGQTPEAPGGTSEEEGHQEHH